MWIQQLKKNRKTTALIFTCVVVFFVFLFSHPVFAQANVQNGDVFGTQAIDANTALSNKSPIQIAVNIINIGLSLLGIIALGIVLYGGFVYMTSGGSEDKIATAKKILVNGTIGLAIILSSWAITRFILSKLGEATGASGLGSLLGNGNGQEFDDFAGTGGPGKTIRDHYPTRDQKDVKRNTRIAITFNEAIDPQSIIENTNKTCWGDDGKPTTNCQKNGEEIVNPYYGDCYTVPGQQFNWATDCDTLKTAAIGIFATGTLGVYDGVNLKPNAPAPAPAYALTTYEDGAEKNAHSFVFKPVNLLGDSLQKMNYTVGVTTEVKKKNGDKALSHLYHWSFETDTQSDFSAPTIISREPGSNDVVPRNQVIQVIFSEPMDPIALQGLLNPNSGFTNLIFGNQQIQGEWKLSNGYQTAEFVSNQSCGENSCGEIMYCLPQVECAAGQNPDQCIAETEILARTAKPIANNSFESIPFTGITDLSGNALDGNADTKIDGKPDMPGDFKTIGKDGNGDERKADNAYWQFRISNMIDRTAPYVQTVLPPVDAEGVKGNEPIVISFSKPLFAQTLRFIGIEEHPKPAKLDDIWFQARSERQENGKDTVTLTHREFGPNGVDLFYFPSIPSKVKDIRQNCLYPGYGPFSEQKGQRTVCSIDADGKTQGCTPVVNDSAHDTGCAQTTLREKSTAANLAECLTELEKMSQKVLP